MRRLRVAGWVLVLAVACGAASGPVSPVVKYGSVPAGVTLEGTAAGFDKIETARYDPKANQFVLNDSDTYANPLSRRDAIHLLKALIEDDRVGVSLLPSEKTLVYGSISPRGRTAKELLKADKLLGGVVFARWRYIQGVKLPGNYQPKRVAKRTIQTAAHFNLTDFVFEKKEKRYTPVSRQLQVTLYAFTDKRAEDGGLLPDEEATREGRFEPEDKENAAHVRTHAAEYMKLEQINPAVQCGEFAAFVRHLRESGVDLPALLKSM